jgi:formylglycine-generating enzyme required for sulfatase activity
LFKFIFLLIPVLLFSESKDLNSLVSTTLKTITAERIDSESLQFDEAKELFDKINLQLEEEKSRFKSRTLKLSIDASYLHRSLKEKKEDIEGVSALIQRKETKLEQVRKDLEIEQNYIFELEKLAKKETSFNSNISTKGYLFAFVEDRRSVTRDKFIERAVEEINREAIGQLNGIFVESIKKFDRKLYQRIRTTSSGTAISDSSETTTKLFFSKNRRTSVLIYGTTVDLYPFEESNKAVSKHGRKDFGVKYVSIVKNDRDIERVLSKIQAEYPRLKIDSSIQNRIEQALKTNDEHNEKSRNIVLEIEKNSADFKKKITKRIQKRKEMIKVLQNQEKLLSDEVAELSVDFQVLSREKQILEDKFSLLQSELIEVKRSIKFTRAEMYDRKHSNAVRETKEIAKELFLDIDKSLLKTSKSMETIFNGEDILKDIVNEIEYDKFYVKSVVIPYFVSGTDRTGALVSLSIEFRDRNLPKRKELEKYRFVKIEKGTFKFGSQNGESDEKPVRNWTIQKDFYIGKYEVTIGEYLQFAKEIKSRFPKWWKKEKQYSNICFEETCPITGVSWEDAVAYAEWLSKTRGEKYRLPTETEWEYVAKAGLNLERGFMNGKLEDFSWFSENSGGTIHPVGQKNPNPFGVYDIIGNVWEYCADSYNRNYLTKKSSTFKSMRGGDWKTKRPYLRSSNRAKYHKDKKSSSIGFRLVKEIKK